MKYVFDFNKRIMPKMAKKFKIAKCFGLLTHYYLYKQP